MMSSGMSAADVAVLTGNAGNSRGCNDGFGWGGEGILWIIVLFALFGWGGFGGGWGGNGGGGFNTPAGSGTVTRAELFEGFNNQGVNSALTGLRDGQFGIEQTLCNGFAGVNSSITNLGYQLQDCCCQTQRAVDGVNYNMAMQTNALQNTMNQNANALQSQLCNGFRDVIDAQNAGTQRIVDLITQDKIQSLQTELQSAQLQLSNANQTTNIVNALRPTPVPSYPVLSPYTSIVSPTGFAFGNGCGCNTCGCGC